MSRSALWRQEGNVKERQRQAEELFQLAVEEGRNNRAKNLVPLWGPDDSFHLNPMLLQNIIKSQYFQKCCRDVNDWNMLVDQIYYDVKHVEPFSQGSSREPSTAFCLLLRLFTLRCTEKQMKLLLDHPDSPYIRAIGFLYLRYACDPKLVFNWIEPYLYDEEPIQAKASSMKHKGDSDTIGDYVRRLFSDKNYMGTMLPRLPVHLERDIQVKLLQAEKIENRAKKHASNSNTMNHFKRVGSKVMALYGDDENPIRWYEAVVDRIITTDPETSQPYRSPKFVVTFPEYGNTETVSLGEMEMIGAQDDTDSKKIQRGGYSERDYGRGDSRGHRRDDHGYSNRSSQDDRGYGRDHGRDYDRKYSGQNERGYGDRGRGYDDRKDRWRRNDRDDSRGGGRSYAGDYEENLYEEVRRRERETVTSSGRFASSWRLPSTKESLASSSRHAPHRSYSPPPNRLPSSSNRAQVPPLTTNSDSSTPAPKKRTAEELAVIQEKKRKLMAKYG